MGRKIDTKFLFNVQESKPNKVKKFVKKEVDEATETEVDETTKTDIEGEDENEKDL